jgi:putative cell wall-binding protein
MAHRSFMGAQNKGRLHMHRPSFKRSAAALAAVAISSAGLLAVAAPAGAVPATVTTNTAGSQPTLVNNAPNQSAGNLTLNVTAANGDEIKLTLDDGDPADNCVTATDFIVFSSIPTTNHPSLSTGVASKADADCPAGTADTIIFTATAGFSGNVVVSGLRYAVGATVSPGPIRTFANGQSAANATVASVNRIEGASRYATAANIARTAFECSDTAIVASGENFPDALAANFLAGNRNAPVLLVQQGALPPETKAALFDLGVKNVTLIGGGDAIATAVSSAITALEVSTCIEGEDATDAAGTTKITATRIEGASRYQTAHLVAAAAGTTIGTFDAEGPCNEGGAVKTAILASGENFPDALAAGPLSYTGATDPACGNGNPIPLVLTEAGALNASAKAFIEEEDIVNVIVLGGNLAISSTVSSAVDALPGVSVTRIEGTTRQDTAAELAELLVSRGLAGEAYVARGDTFPDALAGGPLAGRVTGPILLTQSSVAAGSAATTFLEDNEGINTANLFGGTTALNNTVFGQIAQAFIDRATNI